MSQTKVKSRMYASKLQTERSPVVKRVMVAETNTDAPKSFCGVPDGTGHRDMARSESSARELGRPVLRKQGTGVGWSRSSGEAGNDRGAKGSCLHGVSNGDGRTRLADMAHYAKRRKRCVQKGTMVWCDAPCSSWEKLTAKADAGTRVRASEITEGQVRMEGRLREEMRGRRQGRGRRAAASRKDKLVEFGIDTKKSVMMLPDRGTSEQNK